jgi:hypothetical protein
LFTIERSIVVMIISDWLDRVLNTLVKLLIEMSVVAIMHIIS